MNAIKRSALFASQVLFSIITPPLLIPSIAKLRLTRSFISFCFGRSYGDRYQDIIDSFDDRYGLAMAQGIAKAKEMGGDSISIVVDSGTGTGYVTRQAAKYFPHATFIAFDVLPGMLAQARANCKDIQTDVFHVQADAFELPLADGSVDLILAQNTMPCFEEFARVCRPGGIVVYVDSSAGWISGLAKMLVARQNLFENVWGERVDLGFYVLAQKRDNGQRTGRQVTEGKTRNERLMSLLRCPTDKSSISLDGNFMYCSRGHQYPVHADFPILMTDMHLAKKQTATSR